MNLDEVLSGSAGLAGVQWALREKPTRRRLHAVVQSLLEPGWQPDVFRLRRAKYKPGRKLNAFFDVDIRPAQPRGETEERLFRPVAVTWKPLEPRTASENEADAAAQDEILQRGLAAPFRCLRAEHPEWALRILVSPLDPTFPQLARISDPATIGGMVDEAGIPGVKPGAGYISTAVRYRPGERHVLRYEPLPRTGREGVLFAKLYRKAEAAARAGRVAVRVGEWLESRDSVMIGVRPAAVILGESLVLYHRVPGMPLSRLLRRPGRDLSGLLRAAGAGVRELHSGPASLADELEPNPPEKEMRAAARASEHIQALLPAAYDQIQAVLERVSNVLAGLPGEEPGFTHSDFKADHLLVTPRGLALIDFDTCSLADPALDVGKFLADLDFWCANYGRDGAEEIQGHFLEGYAPASPSVLADRLARARAYHALVLVKITARRVRLFDPRWAQLTAQLVERASQVSLEALSALKAPAGKTTV